MRLEEQLHRHVGRTPQPLRDAREGPEPGHADGRLRADQAGQEAADHLYQCLTWDRGVELTDHKRFTMATDIQVYFCDPHSPWQRGSNENTNGCCASTFPRELISRCTPRRGELRRE